VPSDFLVACASRCLCLRAKNDAVDFGFGTKAHQFDRSSWNHLCTAIRFAAGSPSFRSVTFKQPSKGR